MPLLLSCLMLCVFDKPELKTIPLGRVHVGRDLWEIKLGLHYEDWFYHQVQVLRNGQKVEAITEQHLRIVRVDAPVSWPVFAVKDHSGAGSGESTWFYGIHNREFKLMGKGPDGEIGGPIFRDLDGDGVQEWMVDDNDWYNYLEAGPYWYYAYKVAPDGRLKLWKKLRNKQRKPLPRSPKFDEYRW